MLTGRYGSCRRNDTRHALDEGEDAMESNGPTLGVNSEELWREVGAADCIVGM